ncbi:MAG TPA: MerR family transcriptional regulator [Pseudonocardiaceae bacterium]
MAEWRGDAIQQEASEPEMLSVGELARAAGVSVRTLQYYDRQGLLEAGVDSAGRRHYGREDVLKLQQILFLKSFGFSLVEIKDRLIGENDPGELVAMFARQRRLLVGEIERLQESVSTLDEMIPEVQRCGEVSLARLMLLIELRQQDFPYTSVLDYLSDVQLRALTRTGRGDPQTSERIEELTAELVRLYRQGTDPKGRAGQDFADRWWKLVQRVTGSNPSLLEALLSAGTDVSRWTRESRELIAAVRFFLAQACHTYFADHDIPIPAPLARELASRPTKTSR